MKLSIVIASATNGCIGKNNALPWHIPKDLQRFKNITTQDNNNNNIILMGRKTFESIGKALPDRISYVLTSAPPKKKQDTEGPVNYFTSLEEALSDIEWWEGFLGIEYNVCIIGGSSLFQEVINKKTVNVIHHTLIHGDVEGDTFIQIPDWIITDEEFVPADAKNKFDITFRKLIRP
jgi:dihydrofolate reductase